MVALLAMLFSGGEAVAQRIVLKSNALEWAALSPNIGGEIVLNSHLSIEASASFNPLDTEKYKLRYFRLQPEIRYWFSRPLAHHFLGITTVYVDNNLRFKEKNLRGDAYGAGLSYGYCWLLGERWNLEANLGVGMLRYRQLKYNNGEPFPGRPNFTGWTFAPLKAALTFSYILR